jgi:RimJ/RimL family protein N-acetyltransferase
MPDLNPLGQPVGEVVAGWTPRPHPTPVRLTGRYVVLEPLTVDHVPALYSALCGPDDDGLWTYRTVDRPRDDAAMAQHVLALLAAKDQEVWAVMTPDGAAGLTSLMRIDPTHGQAEVAGVVYAQRLQRTPATTEATHMLMRWVFDHLGYRRFEWKCDSLNEPSRRAAARLGFTYEGTFRNHLVVKGRTRDTAWFSVTDAEWPAVRAAHEAWLDPANFDGAGRQVSPLRGRVEGWTSD